MDNQWIDIWGVCYGGWFCHAEYLTEQEAQEEFTRMQNTHPEFKGEIVHIPNARYGDMHIAGFGPFRPYSGMVVNG